MVEPVTTAALIGAGASLVGGAFQASQAKGASTKQRHFAREMWDKQMQASNTAVQRRVKDLKAAGINPILAAGGQGAAIPSPTSYNVPKFENIGAAAAQAGVQAYSAKAQAQLAEGQGEMLDQNIAHSMVTIRKELSQIDMNEQQTANLAVLKEKIVAEIRQLEHQGQQTQASARYIQAQASSQEYTNLGKQAVFDLLDSSAIGNTLENIFPGKSDEALRVILKALGNMVWRTIR